MPDNVDGVIPGSQPLSPSDAVTMVAQICEAASQSGPDEDPVVNVQCRIRATSARNREYMLGSIGQLLAVPGYDEPAARSWTIEIEPDAVILTVQEGRSGNLLVLLEWLQAFEANCVAAATRRGLG